MKHIKATTEAISNNLPLDEIPQKNNFKVSDFT
jgi:hypothetical protein